MKKYFIIITIFILVSCEIKPKNIMPKEKFIDLLVDVHIYDAIMNKEGYLDKSITINDTASYYNYLFKKYEITRKQYREIMQYYASDIEEFSLIYEEVINRFNLKLIEIDSLEVDEVAEIKDSTNLWNLKDEWNLPIDGEKETIKYNIITNKSGIYTLSAEIKLFEDDGSVNQRMSIFAYYTDGSFDTNSNGALNKDGEFNIHEVSIKTNPNKTVEYITGWLLDHSEGTTKKHSIIKNIRLDYTSENDSM